MVVENWIMIGLVFVMLIFVLVDIVRDWKIIHGSVSGRYFHKFVRRVGRDLPDNISGCVIILLSPDGNHLTAKVASSTTDGWSEKRMMEMAMEVTSQRLIRLVNEEDR